jgi:aminoglycoside 6'-N-acetyltransferase I
LPEILLMSIEVRILRAGDDAVLSRVAPGVFDDPIDPPRAAEFLADPRHHLAVALDEDLVVGFVSAVHYVHPDKRQPELWINEVGVAASHQGRGLGKAILRAVLAEGQRLGCSEAWVLTERSNPRAMRLYASQGGEEAPEDAVMFTFRLCAEEPSR